MCVRPHVSVHMHTGCSDVENGASDAAGHAEQEDEDLLLLFYFSEDDFLAGGTATLRIVLRRGCRCALPASGREGVVEFKLEGNGVSHHVFQVRACYLSPSTMPSAG